jgi:hypothetical protein
MPVLPRDVEALQRLANGEVAKVVAPYQSWNKRILRLLGAKTMTQAVAEALRRGLIR